MEKIAHPQELQAELRRLLAVCGEGQPSREKLAKELQALSQRVAVGVGGDASDAVANAMWNLSLAIGGIDFRLFDPQGRLPELSATDRRELHGAFEDLNKVMAQLRDIKRYLDASDMTIPNRTMKR